MSRDAPRRRVATVYERGGAEFGRVLSFSDGLFSIAMTLLVVALAVPKLTARPPCWVTTSVIRSRSPRTRSSPLR